MNRSGLKGKLMIKIGAAILALCAVGVCAAQTAATAAHPAAKHYRLTFVLAYPDGKLPSQSFALDVPLVPGRSSVSSMTASGASTGQPGGSYQENLQCLDIHETETGLAAKVDFSMDSVPLDPLPGITEPRHSQLVFERQIDVALGKPTLITNEMHRMPLKKGDEVYTNALPPAPQITVTATEL